MERSAIPAHWDTLGCPQAFPAHGEGAPVRTLGRMRSSSVRRAGCPHPAADDLHQNSRRERSGDRSLRAGGSVPRPVILSERSEPKDFALPAQAALSCRLLKNPTSSAGILRRPCLLRMTPGWHNTPSLCRVLRLGRRKDSHASYFPLWGTGKYDKGIHQRARWFMHMPPACADMIRILPPGKNNSHPDGWLLFLAAEEGFEPSQTESESGVLPLHNSAKRKSYYTSCPLVMPRSGR